MVVAKKRPQRLLINSFNKADVRLLQLQPEDERILSIAVDRV